MKKNNTKNTPPVKIPAIEFAKYLGQIILMWLICAGVGTAIIYMFFDKSIITNPPRRTIISLSVVSLIYFVFAILGWLAMVRKRNTR